MQRFPYLTEYVNHVFSEEKSHWDYILIRPILLVSYFFLRCLVFPLKFVFHRVPYGFEAFCIDWSMAIGMKYLAKTDAAELMLRHVQIEPLLYRYILGAKADQALGERKKLNGIEGDFGVEDISTGWFNR